MYLRSGCPIANQVIAHVLHNLLAVVVLVTTRVLVGPFEGEDRAGVVVEASNIVATAVVVLGVKHSVVSMHMYYHLPSTYMYIY